MTGPKCVYNCKREIPSGRRVLYFEFKEGKPIVSCDTCTPPEEWDELLGLCGCGREIWGLRDELVGVLLFCSVGCQAEGLQSPAVQQRACEECGESLGEARTGTRYCRNACRQKSYRRRNAAA